MQPGGADSLGLCGMMEAKHGEILPSQSRCAQYHLFRFQSGSDMALAIMIEVHNGWLLLRCLFHPLTEPHIFECTLP